MKSMHPPNAQHTAVTKDLIMYSRTFGCPFVTLAKRVLDDYGIPYREIFIDTDAEAQARVLRWTGFKSVPTLVAAPKGELVPIDEPKQLPQGTSPRGIDRGFIITEPDENQLLIWLRANGFLDERP